jgi:hypothetical protein
MQQQQYAVPAQYYSIDVECVATGTQHNDRAVAQIGIVDQYEQVRRQSPTARRLAPSRPSTCDAVAHASQAGSAARPGACPGQQGCMPLHRCRRRRRRR